MSKFKHIKKVHFAEMPSVKYLDKNTAYLKGGLHIYLTNNKNHQRRFYLPENFCVDISKLKSKLTKYDITAICAYKYVNNLCFSSYSKSMLWKMLRYSNGLISSIIKFLEITRLT